MTEVHDREREARDKVWAAVIALDDPEPGQNRAAVHAVTTALDAYRDAVEARVRWDQQADAEGYNIPGGPR